MSSATEHYSLPANTNPQRPHTVDKGAHDRERLSQPVRRLA
jgi:hypothetical protein